MHEFNLVKNFFYEDIPKELLNENKVNYINVKNNISLKDKSNSVVIYKIPVDINDISDDSFEFLNKGIVIWLIEHGAIIGETIHITLGSKGVSNE